MAELIYDDAFEEEIEDLLPSMEKLYDKVHKDLGYLEEYGGETLVPGSNLPPEIQTLQSGKYNGKIKYVRTKQGSDIFRVYFLRGGERFVCLKGWHKTQQDIPKRILNQIERRFEHWEPYLRS